MKERPILFSGEMVRAMLAGRKTQTRRFVSGTALEWLQPGMFATQFVAKPENGLSPYGYAGDHLWVKETHAAFGRWETRFSQKKNRDEWHFVDMTLECGLEYRFDFGGWPSGGRGAIPGWHVRPSIFMPRIASRITLEVTDVRIEQLQEITDDDAFAEGCPDDATFPVDWYRDLWNGLNATRGHGWDTNPWVWVVAFKRLESSVRNGE